MAPRRGVRAEPVVEEKRGTSLVFDEALTWRPGKPIPSATLLQRLEVLSTELKSMEQEDCDKDSLTKIAKELATQGLLSHKDRGIRAFTACCLVDILSLCAPDAPFTASQLREIFSLFITSILPALSDPSDAYNAQHVYVMTSLSEIRSIALLTDLPNAEPLVLHLFTSMFDIISGSSKASTGEQISKNVEYHMNSLLVTVVDEAASLPGPVVDVIIAQFLRAAITNTVKTKKNGEVDDTQSTLLAKEVPAAYRMAKFICDSCSEKMSRYVSQYFNEVILDASGTNGVSGDKSANNEGSDDDETAGPTEQDLEELGKAHRLLRELWRASPAVLQNVIPQLDAELSAENAQLRLLATETLGDIVSGIGAAGPPSPPVMDPAAYPTTKLHEDLASSALVNVMKAPRSPESFAQTHAAVYSSFLTRRNDKSPLIRCAWVACAGRILATSAGGIGLSREDTTVLTGGISEKLSDVDERVRVAAIKAVADFGFQAFIFKLASTGDANKSGSILSSLTDRARDKRHSVRVEGMTTIARLWGVAAGEIIAGTDEVTAPMNSVPSRIVDVYYANDKDLNVLLDRVIFEQLLPLAFPATKGKSMKTASGGSKGADSSNGDDTFDADKIRVQRLLVFVRSLDTRAKTAFFRLQARQSAYKHVLEQFLLKCEEFNGGVADGNTKATRDALGKIIQWLSDMLPDGLRATADLWKYAKMHDRRTYTLIRFTISPETDFKTVHNAIKEFTKRVENAPGAPAGMLETFMPLLYRAAYIVYNRSNLPSILAYSRNDDDSLGATAQELLNEISERSPAVFKAQVKQLCKILEEQAPSETEGNDPSVVQTLKACAGYAVKYPEEIPTDRKFIHAMLQFAKFATPPGAAKYAVNILMAALGKKEMHAKDLLSRATNDWDTESPHSLTRLATISQLMLAAPTTVDDETWDTILDITMEKILFRNSASPKTSDSAWQEDAELDPECEAKCWALKILVNRLRSSKDPEELQSLSGPVFKLLNVLIKKEGELSKKEDTPINFKSRLRLLAAQLMLKLCTSNKTFDALLDPPSFIQLACVAQDPIFNVRRRFLSKLQKYLGKGQLPSRFFTIIFLTAFEPDALFRQSTATWIRSQAKQMQDRKSATLEHLLPRLLSLLAHHPDYSPAEEDLNDTAKYILLYVSTVSNEDNVGLLYKYAQRVKQVQDAIDQHKSEDLYILSDLAQTVLRLWQERRGWNMQIYAQKLALSRDLFAAMPSHDVAQAVATKSFLPDGMEESLSGLIRASDQKKRKLNGDSNGHTAKKARTSSGVKIPSRPAPKKPVKAKSVRTPRRNKDSSPTSATTTGERRRSGRGASTGKRYADRDDSEDDQEMMNGVSKWQYDDGHVESDEPEDDTNDDGEEEEDVTEEEKETGDEDNDPEKEATDIEDNRVTEGQDGDGAHLVEDTTKAVPSSEPQSESEDSETRTSRRNPKTSKGTAKGASTRSRVTALKPTKSRTERTKKSPSPAPTSSISVTDSSTRRSARAVARPHRA